MLDSTRTGRPDETQDRLEEYAVYETDGIDRLSHYKTREFAEPGEVPTSEFTPCDVGFTWERNRKTSPADRREADADVTSGARLPDSLAVGENVWFRVAFTVPESMAGRPVYLRFVADPVPEREGGMGPPHLECLCYRDGEPWQAFDDGHQDLLLTESADGGEEFDLLIEAGTTTLWGLLDVEEFVLESAHIYATREPVRELYHNYAVLNDLRKTIPEDSPNWGKITRALVEASHAVVFEADDEAEIDRSAAAALDRLDELKSELTSDLSGYDVTAVGHAHIDLAWLWPWSETVRKGARSFSNVLKLMEEYPEFTFLQSQPHLYEFARNRYPSVDGRIEERVDEGRWNPTGALWVESDINLVSGEGLARQFLLGKRYFRDRFDVDPEIVFIPDVFGYSGALPEIANAADCPFFFTQKMSWNEDNEFPHSSFNWEGIGGSSVLAHFPPGDTYNGEMSVEQVRDTVVEHDENDVVDESAYLVGWGDGGGGPTRDMLERRKVIDETGSLPDVSFGSLQGFFDRLDEASDDLPTWTGELYLEKHRGTLTTQAETKRNNRRGEYALREAEVWSSLALALRDEPYPHAKLEDAWKVLLFNQFHDILPGSSVADVYADADRDYRQMFETVDDAIDDALSSLLPTTDRSPFVCVTNSLPWSRTTVVGVDDDDLPPELDAPTAARADGSASPVQPAATGEADYVFTATDVPPFGARTFELDDAGAPDDDPVSASKERLENDRLRVEFRDDGTFTAYDKDARRQLFDGSGNRLVSYRDHPEEYEAWDVEADVYDVGEQLPAPSTVEAVETGPVRATVRQTYEVGDSRVVQDVSLCRGGEQIDVRTDVEWREDDRLLKAHFPIDVHATEATYDVQYGHITRDTHDNTSWDEARYEEPHRTWVDVAEGNYGVAVLNDAKYGVHADGTDVSLSLLRSPDWPDPDADRGRHEFAYAIRPHESDFRDGGVVQAGYDMNVPARTRSVEERVEHAPVAVDRDGVVVEAIKRAEDAEDAIVVRAYEAWGQRTTATFDVDFPLAAAHEANLIEDVEGELEVTDGRFSAEFEPFDIRTFVLTLE